MDTNQERLSAHLQYFFRRVGEKFNEFPNGEQLPPLIGLLGQTKTETFTLIPLGLESEINSVEGKNTIGAILTQMLDTAPDDLPEELVKSGVTSIVGHIVLTETWLVEKKASESLEDVMPSESKNRQEAIHLNFTPKAGQAIGMMYIIDPKTRKVDLDKAIVNSGPVQSRFDQRNTTERPH